MTKHDKILKQQALRFVLDTYPDKINYHQKEIDDLKKLIDDAKVELDKLSKVEVE